MKINIGIPIDLNKLLETRLLIQAGSGGGKGTVKYSEWVALKAKFNHTCPACGKKEPEIKLTRDHIKPIKHGGLNVIANIQPLCFACNSTKKDRHIKYKPLI